MLDTELYEKLMEKYLERENLTISLIQKEEGIGFPLAERVYREWNQFHDELFWHNAIYEISFMDEVVTPIRIMRHFHISYYFSTKLLEYYLEQVNG